MNRLIQNKYLFSAFFLIFLLALSGCGAYYNTFYNAKKFYSEAEKQRLKQEKQLQKSQTSVRQSQRNPRRRVSNIQGYKKAIEKASKVLQLYPKSKYVDDALMIIGKSFFYENENIKARRKFKELLAAFPKSEYAPEARLLLGKTELAMGKYDAAEKTLNELLLDKENKKYFSDARLELGEMYFKQKLYAQAVEQYERTINKIKDKNVRAKAQLRIGESYLQLNDYSKAAAAFGRVRKYKPDVEFLYQADLKHAFCLDKLNQYEKALNVYDRMLKLTLTNYETGNVYLQSAITLEEKGDLKRAYEAFQNVIDNYPKTAASAEAYYRLGLYELHQSRDFSQALGYFKKAVKEYPRGEFVKAARAQIQAITKLNELGDTIWALEDAYVRKLNKEDIGGDTVLVLGGNQTANPDTARTDTALVSARRDSARADSLRWKEKIQNNPFAETFLTEAQKKEKARQDSLKTAALKKKRRSIKIPSDPEEIKKMLVQNDFQLAELYYFQFAMSDSALQEYNRLITNFPENPGIPKALFSMAYIYRQNLKDTTAADSLYREIVRRYPKTGYAKEARKTLGLPPIEDENLLAEQIFLEAEKLNFDQNLPQEAIKKYREVVRKYPDSVYAPKALYAVAWIYENELGRGKEALGAYQSLKNEFPKTLFASVAEKKLRAVERVKQARADSIKQKAAKAAKKQTAVIDLKHKTAADSLNRKAVKDSTQTKTEAVKTDTLREAPK